MSERRDDERIRLLCDPIAEALANIEDCVIIVSRDRLVEYMNTAAESVFSHVLKDNKPVAFIEVVRDYECDSLLRRCIETGQSQSVAVKLRQGNRLLQVTMVPDKGQQHYIAVMKDLTERQQLEDMRRNFISNISHEFRTPLASIKLLVETLIDGAVRDPQRALDFLQKINVEADKLTYMTDELQELAVIERGGSVMVKEWADIGQIVKNVVSRLEAQARAGGLGIETDVEAGLPGPVIDDDRIERVLMNLVHNAIKFTGPGGRITIKAVLQGREILVSVEDTGYGIAPEDLPRIFERFYKADRSRNSEGSGLGLSISKHIITAHGGRIWAESEMGRGSTFSFTLPLSE